MNPTTQAPKPGIKSHREFKNAAASQNPTIGKPTAKSSNSAFRRHRVAKISCGIAKSLGTCG